MAVITLAYLSLALPMVTLCYPDQWLYQIYVDSQTGVNNYSCWEEGYSTPCLSLNLALAGAQHYRHHSTLIILQPGQHQLHSGSETQLRNMFQLAIVGNGSQGEVVIKCKPLAGLAFFWSQDIELRNVNLVKCGALQNSTSKQRSFLRIYVAIFFLNCKAIQLTNVHVTMSNGTGGVIYNPVGVVNITRCLFSHNGVSGEQQAMYGGGGLAIEVNEVTSQSSCVITNSTFTHNTASSGQYSYLSPTTNPSGYFGLGRGGGISVVFREETMNNAVQLDGVHLENNMAQFGGGLFMAFHDNTRGNTVSINNAKVAGNEALLGAGNLLTNTIGGGAFIGLASGTTNYPSNNTVIITSSGFIGNEAYTGGGVAVDVVYNDHNCIFAGNKLLMENCAFGNNNAIHGSLVHLSQSSKSSPTLLNTTICCSNFTNGHSEHVFSCSGSVFLLSTTLTLKGTLIFSGNNCSALRLLSSSIELLPSTQLQFIDNQAFNGPALRITDCSSIIVNNGSTFLFNNNKAFHRGGAILAESCSLGQAGGSSCFIQHSNSALHPDDWNISVTFTGNYMHWLRFYNNSIYMDSINSCIWPGSVESTRNNTFCWRGWSYLDTHGVTDDCLTYLRSGPASINTTLPTNYSLYPGGCIHQYDFTVYDAWGRNITSDVYLWLDSISDPFVYVHHPYKGAYDIDYTTFCLSPDVEDGVDYIHAKILVRPSGRLTGLVLDLIFKPCENGSTFSSWTGCTHPAAGVKNYYTTCDNTTKNSRCNTYFYTDCTTSIYYNNSFYRLQIPICGRCASDGYGVAFNYPNFICAKCEPQGWILFLFLQLVPLWIMMILFAVLHINITNGDLNGYILYSQLVSLQFPGLGYSSWLPIGLLCNNTMYFLTIPLIVYSIWNLNFLTLYPIPFCLPLVDTAAGVILLQYVIAACPLVFIIVTYTWIRWYNNGYRFVVYTTRPVHQLLARFWKKFKIQPSLVDTYAGLIRLSYMRFLTLSVKLLQYIAIEMKTEASMNNTLEHVVLGTVAVLCLLVFVIPPMVVLLFYHLKIFQQCLTWCKLDRPGLHALVDAYQGCFKNTATDGRERRYFAGLSLLFRFCYLVLIVLPSSTCVILLHQNLIDSIFYLYLPLSVSEACLSSVMAGLVVIMQPYKKTAHNVIDFLIFFFLTVIGASSFVWQVPLFSLWGPMYLPFFALLCYFIFRLCKWYIVVLRKSNTQPDDAGDPSPSQQMPFSKPHTTSEVTLDDYVMDDLYADRMINPSGYGEQPCTYQLVNELSLNVPD